MSASPLVLPRQGAQLDDAKALNQLLSTVQSQALVEGGRPIISLAQTIEPVDALGVLAAMAEPNQLHFYWENPVQGESIVALGARVAHQVHGPSRFRQAQNYIQSCLARVFRVGDLPVQEGALQQSPHLFCSFTFFDTLSDPYGPFPPATVFLPELEVIQTPHQSTLIINFDIQNKTNIPLIIEQVQQQIKAIRWSRRLTNAPSIATSYPSVSLKNYPSANFSATVTSALESIHNQEFSKIVLANTLEVMTMESFQLVDALHNLRRSHPGCYIFSTSNGKGQHFIGASPERLLSIQQGQLITDALAGSAPRGETPDEDAQLARQLLNSEKERREHQAVSHFIIERLQALGLLPQRSPLRLLQLSNIQHLWTPIYAQVPAGITPLDILAQLHPTPAVAGVPTAIACEQIRRYESFDRALYAAPLGWIDAMGNSNFIVGIRSALITGAHARLYAGAGIVAGSDPQKELAEIQLKLQTLLRAIL